MPVAILTTTGFYAGDVDSATVTFAGATPVKWTMEDVGYDCCESDGDEDLLLFFKTEELDFSQSNDEAYLYTLPGEFIWGKDSVKIVPKEKE